MPMELKTFFQKVLPEPVPSLAWRAPEVFLVGLLVRTLGLHCSGLDLIPGWGHEVPQAEQSSLKQKAKKTEVLNE